MKLNLHDTFNKALPADVVITNRPRRQVSEACFSFTTPRVPSKPKLLHASTEVADFLGLKNEEIFEEEFLSVFSGKQILENTQPYAMCYGGHQFGNWAGQLGDGRAINLFEVSHNNKQWALQLKGAGETPYSRTADGLAVLRSSIREYLCAEAMHHLGVPTTRSLSLIVTGDEVLRDVLYNGNPAYEKGAIVCRVSPSFVRFGNFEILTARNDIDTLKKLADYTISQFYPEINSGSQESYIDFFRKVAETTRKMVVEWQRVGFVHGVMNTDNMSILGLTIDYGPYGWLEGYDPNWTPNTTDREHHRYRFGNQPNVALWNLVQLANALYPLIGETKPLEDILDDYKDNFAIDYLNMMRLKLGLIDLKLEEDKNLVYDLEEVLKLTETDMTIFFRKLADISKEKVIENVSKNFEQINTSFYKPDDLNPEIIDAWHAWLILYVHRLGQEKTSDSARKKAMNSVNPKYVLRNYMAQLAIDAADNNDYSIINELYDLLKKPYTEQPLAEKWFAKRPEWARNKIGCSMLSCSS